MTPVDEAEERRPAASAGLLAHMPAPVLVLLCLLALTLVGWLALRSPLPALAAGGLWAIFLLRGRIATQVRRAVHGAPQTAAASPTPAAAPAPSPPPIQQTPAATVIMADLRMDGRLEAKGPVDVFGRLSGQVRCGPLRIYAGGALHGDVVCEKIGLAADARLEGVVSTTASGGA